MLRERGTGRRLSGQRGALGSTGVARLRSYHGDDLRVVDHAIDERRRGGGVREDAGPLAEGQVGGQDELVVRTRLRRSERRLTTWKEEVGGARVVGEVADLVDDEESTCGVVVEPPTEPARRLLRAQIEEEFGGGLEEYV